MIKAFVFDIGDCIEPSTNIKISSLRWLKKKNQLPNKFVKTYIELDKYHEPHMFHAQGEPKIMRMTLKKLKSKANAKVLSRLMNKAYWKILKSYYLKDNKGKEFIRAAKYLKKRNYKIGIISDNSLNAKVLYFDLWNNFGLKFNSFVVSEDVGSEKPSKKPFQASISELKVNPNEAIYFGNNLKRDSIAKRYGWNFVWVYGFDKIKINKFKGIKIEFITLKSLISLLKKQG